MSELLTTKQLAERWKVAPYKISRLKHTGDLPFTLPRKRPLYRLQDVEKYESENRAKIERGLVNEPKKRPLVLYKLTHIETLLERIADSMDKLVAINTVPEG